MIYAAFIITYKRPEILMNTINSLLSQSKPPQKILIIDNDPELSAKSIVDYSGEVNFSYYATGINAGPAGGAYWGLKKLFEEGWEWVLWVDDDDAPSSQNQIETIFSILNSVSQPDLIGVLGAAGVLYNYSKCRIQRIPDGELKDIIHVDMIAGNQFPIVHKRVFDLGILPDKNLFFGFEDLEFCLRVKKNGLQLLVKGDELLRLRKHFNKYGKNKPRGIKKNILHIWREYYSVRTISYILRNNNSYFIFMRYVISNLLKSLLNFKYGLHYGLRHSYFIFKGLSDGIQKNMGLKILPNKKY